MVHRDAPQHHFRMVARRDRHYWRGFLTAKYWMLRKRLATGWKRFVERWIIADGPADQ